MFETKQALIKVIGLGGGGGNAVQHMIEKNLEGVEFIAANTDQQALENLTDADEVIQLGRNVTQGLGAGANPELGKMAAEEEKDTLKEKLEGADMLFIAAGMGGGTGTGAAPVVAEIAKELGILTVAVVTKPFPFEGKQRMAYAEKYIAELMKQVDSIITIPNERLLQVLGKGVSLPEAFAKANDVLYEAVMGISDLITKAGFINVDFADVRTVMSKTGLAMMGIGTAEGTDKAEKAATDAIRSQLLDNIELKDAKGILVNICTGADITIEEYETVGNIIQEITDPDATCVMGVSIEPNLSDSVRITVVATGLKSKDGAFENAKRPTARLTNVIEPSEPARSTEQSNVTAADASDADMPAFLTKQNS